MSKIEERRALGLSGIARQYSTEAVSKPNTEAALAQAKERVTEISAPVTKKKRGRPRAYSDNAERQRRYRERKKAKP